MHLEKEGSCDKMNSKDSAKVIVSEGKDRSEEHTSELQSLMRISYAVFCFYRIRFDNKFNTSVHAICNVSISPVSYTHLYHNCPLFQGALPRIYLTVCPVFSIFYMNRFITTVPQVQS